MARFNLAASGLTNTSTSEFPLVKADMEITGPGGYGFAPLLERMSLHTGAPVECIVVATGASMANYLAMSVVLDPNDEVLIERPAYGLFADIAAYLGVRVSYFDRSPETDFSVSVDAIEEAITPHTKLIVLSNLHNPSGALLSEETLLEIGRLAQRSGLRVLVDEVYLEMMFEQSLPICPSGSDCRSGSDCQSGSGAFEVGRKLSDGGENPFIVTNSLTKTYGLSGLRCGWILAAPHLARRMWRLNDLFGVNAAHVAEQMSVAAFDRLDAVRTKARSLLTTNRALLDAFLDANPELPCFRPIAGSVVFPRLPYGDADLFTNLLRDKYETTVVPGRFFGLPQHFRIGIGGDTAIVRGGLERLTTALADFIAK